jgi:hypothetical protein
VNEGFESLIEVLAGRPVNFVVLRPPVAVLRQRGIDRLPEEAAYLADRRLPYIGLWVDPSGMDPQSVVDLLLDRGAEAAWVVSAGTCQPGL